MTTNISKEELKKKVAALARKHSRNHKAVADALNEGEILDPTGKKWTNESVRAFRRRNKLDAGVTKDRGEHSQENVTQDLVTTTSTQVTNGLVDDSPPPVTHDVGTTTNGDSTKDMVKDSPTPSPTNNMVSASPSSGAAPNNQETTRQLPEWLDAAAWSDMESILSWWRSGGPGAPRQDARPVFEGQRKNTGVHIHETILQRAAAKAKADKARTGGSLSQLVELLLWEYLGRPADVLAPSGSEQGEEDPVAL